MLYALLSVGNYLNLYGIKKITYSMRKIISMFVIFTVIVSGGCTSENDAYQNLSLVEISQNAFTHEGGIGSIKVNRDDVVVVSTQPEWLKIQVRESLILFNVYSNTHTQSRTADIVVSANGSEDLVISIDQSAFLGLVVTPTSLTFTDNVDDQSVAVVASDDFIVSFTENPDNVFKYTRDGNVLRFSTTKPQGRVAYTGRAVLTATDCDQTVTISLNMPKKSVYDYLIGTWTVIRNTSASGHTYSMRFTVKESLSSYNVYLEAPGISAYPFVAEFVDGKVKVSTGQKMGTDGTTYYNFHFNGPQNGSGTYIYNSYGTVAMEAVPVFDEASGKITLTFTDNGQGKERQARDWAFWCGSNYWNFASSVAFYTDLELSKSYTE